MITHYDLFAGIGGFSLALEEVFNEERIKHIFCEWESFPTAVLRKHWPDGDFWGDISDLVAYTGGKGFQGSRSNTSGQHGLSDEVREREITIVTGGFPCQPFSHAGRRRGSDDPRYQWPNMFEVIRNVKPEWVIAENVSGLATWNEGLVLETVCSDLEGEGYTVQAFIIPALAKGAPHRRDRVWIIAHSDNERAASRHREVQEADGEVSERNNHAELGNAAHNDSSDTGRKRWEQGLEEDVRPEGQESGRPKHEYPDWSRDWRRVAIETCNDSVDDGLPRIVDGVPISYAKWRRESLKAYGNAIVPQVAMMIFNAIKEQEYAD